MKNRLVPLNILSSVCSPTLTMYTHYIVQFSLDRYLNDKNKKKNMHSLVEKNTF